MLQEQKEQVNQIINNSGSFAILLNQNASESEILSAEALRKTLAFKNLRVYFISDFSEKIKQKWEPLLKDFSRDPMPQITSIKIPVKESELNEIDYLKSENFLTLEIGTAQKIVREEITIEQKPAKIDAVFCFSNNENVLSQIKEKGIVPDKKNIMFLSPENGTISEQVLNIVKILNIKEHKKEIAELLLASLIVETENFSKHFSPESLEAGKDLLEMGANKKIISTVLEREKQTPILQILGRALTRTRIKDETKTSWTFLSKEDFEKSGELNPDASTIIQITQRLRSLSPAQPTMIILWQDGDGIQVMIKNFDDTKESRDKMLLLSEKAACPLQNDFFVMGPFKSFSEAELQTQKMLKEEGF